MKRFEEMLIDEYGMVSVAITNNNACGRKHDYRMGHLDMRATMAVLFIVKCPKLP
jgi:hypothetical protein